MQISSSADLASLDLKIATRIYYALNAVHTYSHGVQNPALCHIAQDRAGPYCALNFEGAPNLDIPNEARKDAASVESSPLATWHKSAPWLISAVTVLGLIIIFQR
jgi:hypothetical protein